MHQPIFQITIVLIILFGCNSSDSKEPSNSPENRITQTSTAHTPLKLNAYLNDPDPTGTNIRNSPNGAIITTIKPDEKNVELMMVLDSCENGWFRIKGAISGVESDIVLKEQGWIFGKLLAVDTRNYNGQILKFMTAPNGKEVSFSLTQETAGLCILEVSGKWINVEYLGKSGWIDTFWLCGNPLTSCS